MAAATKSELIAITKKEFEKLTKLIESIEADAATKKREDDTSIKDVVAHRAHWIELFLVGTPMVASGKPCTFRQKVTNGAI